MSGLKWHRWRSAALASLTMGGLIAGTAAAEAGGRPAAFIIDANTGHIISASNADEPRFPASLTKMMTLYVVFDLIEQGRLNYQTRIKISDKAASTPPSKLGLSEGDDIALIDAMKALITRSANDIAVAIAEHIAGSEEKFAALMTQSARAIGMKASTFQNASGLPNSNQVTTARDMVTLGLRLHDDFPKHYALFAMREFRYGGNNHANHNTMLNSYEGTEGIKTGYTSASGFNLVASVKRNSKHVMGAVFGGNSAASRNQTMRTLLNIALFKASATKTRTPSAMMAQAKPVPEPRPVVRAAPQEGPSAPKPDAAWNTKVATAPAIKSDTPPEPKPAAVEGPKPREMIEMAKVRPVLVAPRAPKQAPLAIAAAPIVLTTPATPSAAEPEPVKQASVPLDIKLPPLAASAAPQQIPSKPGTSPTRVAAPPMAAQQPVAVAAAPTPLLSAARGAPPSTLQQQAANMTGTQPAPTYNLSGPPRAAPATTAGGVEIQIGAFSSAAEAERQLGLARGKAGDLIGAAPGVAQPASVNGKPIWRARFGGFQSASATNVCSELRRRQIDCLVVKAE